jgi:hypothetical protein
MKKIALFTIAILLSVAGFSQTPVSWNYSAKKIAAGTYEVKIVATIQSPWHIYSQKTPDGGPLPTKIVITKNPMLIPQGTAREVGKLEKKYEEAFGVDVMQFSGKVEFVQVVKTKSEKVKTNVSGTIEYMACTDEQCLPPATINFTLKLD